MPPTGAVGKKGEPISLAEVLVQERLHGIIELNGDEVHEKIKLEDEAPYLADLLEMSATELVAEARRQLIDDEFVETDRRELIFWILKSRIRQDGLMFGEGTLEILPDQFGFLRSPTHHYLASPDDIYLSPSQIRRLGLRRGCTVSGPIRPPKENERYFALLRVDTINQEAPDALLDKPFFDDLMPIPSNRRIVLESPGDDPATRMLDLITPIGFGQCGLIVGPPQSGKTTLVHGMEQAILANHPAACVLTLLIGEPGPLVSVPSSMRNEVIHVTVAEPPMQHIQAVEMVLEKAKRMVEYGKDVVVFIDSLTHLAKAWNGSFQQIFGTARNVMSGGSLTMIATVSIETDDAILDEFKGTSMLEVRLERRLFEKGIRPAINVHKSGTRELESLVSPEEYRQLMTLRQRLLEYSPEDAIGFLLEELRKTSTNALLWSATCPIRGT